MRFFMIPCVFAIVSACASSPAPVTDPDDPNWADPPPEASGTLMDDEIVEACAEARLAMECQFATSAEGFQFSSCECSAFGNAVGQGRLSIIGTNESGAEVEAEFELNEIDSAWTLGKRL